MYTITHAQSTHTTTHATTTTGGSTSTERLGTLGKWWITSAASTALNWTSQVIVGGVLCTCGCWWCFVYALKRRQTTSAASTALNWTSQVVVGGVLCTAGCWWCLLNAWERRQITSAASTALIEPHRKLILFCFVYTLERWWITSVVSTAYNSILQVVDCIVLCTLYRWWMTSVASTALNYTSHT